MTVQDQEFDDLLLAVETDVIDSETIQASTIRPFDYVKDQRQFTHRLLTNENAVKEFDDLIRTGFGNVIFSKEIQPFIAYILDKFKSLREIPTIESMVKQFSNAAEVCLLPGDEAPTNQSLISLYDEIKYDAYLTGLVKLHEDQRKWFNSPDVSVDEIAKQLQERIRELQLIITSAKQTVVTLGEALSSVKDGVLASAKELDWGIQIPFPFLNEILRGLQPGELTTVVAKTGIGKTWFILMMAACALTGNPYLFTPAEKVNKQPRTPEENIRDRKRVLFVSMEMPAIQIARRMAALLTKFGYEEIRSGKFTENGRQETFFRHIDNAVTLFGDKMLIVQVFSPDEVAAYADSMNADLVIVDGFYLMGGSGEKRWEKVQDNIQELRLHSLHSARHYLLSSQLTRKDDALAFSQSIEQDSSIIIEIKASSEQKLAKKLLVKPRKVRDGEIKDEFLYNWDFKNIRLDEEGPFVGAFSQLNEP